MTDAMQLFGYATGDVRVNVVGGEPWFAVKDVCEVLGIVNNRDAVDGLPEGDLTLLPVTSGGQRRELNFVNEPGLYRLVFRSRKPEAERFQDWVCREVLPCVRRTGGYGSAGRRGLGIGTDTLGAVAALVRSDETPDQLLVRAARSGAAQAAAEIRTGVLLSRARMAMPHGTFTRWVRENCAGRFSVRMGQRCRRTAEEFLTSAAAAEFMRLPEAERAAQLSGDGEDGVFMAAVAAFVEERGAAAK